LEKKKKKKKRARENAPQLRFFFTILSAGIGRLQEDLTVLTINIYDHGSFAARNNCA
jgi:hypothetical protein